MDAINAFKLLRSMYASATHKNEIKEQQKNLSKERKKVCGICVRYKCFMHILTLLILFFAFFVIFLSQMQGNDVAGEIKKSTLDPSSLLFCTFIFHFLFHKIRFCAAIYPS
jgi:preprotein translocase subunit SecY